MWEVFDDRLQVVPAGDVVRLDSALLECLGPGCFGLMLLRKLWLMLTGWLVDLSLVVGLGWVGVMLNSLWLGLVGPKMRSDRSRCADPGDGAQVYLYRDSSAPLIHLRRRLRSVLDVVDAISRSGFSLARGLELTRQWGKVLRCGPSGTVTEERLHTVSGLQLPGFGVEVGLMHDELHKFLHDIVVRRKDCAVRGWRAWILEDPLVHPYRWLRPDLVPPSPFLQCDPAATVDGSGCYF